MKRILFLVVVYSLGTLTYDNATADSKNPIQYWMKFKATNKFERTKIANLGVSIEAVVEDSVMTIGNARNLEAAKKSGLLLMNFELTENTYDFPPNDSSFHNYDELSQEMQLLAQQYPNLVKLSSIGKSREGRNLYMLTLSTDEDDLSRPAVFFMGGHHAREHISIETPLLFAKYLLQKFTARDLRIVNLLNNRTVYVLPMVNPDGAEFDIADGEYQMWRKNRAQNNGKDSYGVDLNRNYGYGWGGGGASPYPDDETYRGPSAFSEPETQAVRNFFLSHKNITIDLSFHTFSELILYPWGGKYDKISNEKDYLTHKTMAETMAQWNGYTPEQSSDLYIASGDTTDWAYGQLGVISFTFELDPKMSAFPQRGFYPGQAFINPVVQKNIEPCLYLLEYADNPYRVIEPTPKAYGLNSPLIE